MRRWETKEMRERHNRALTVVVLIEIRVLYNVCMYNVCMSVT